ncbi:MAG: site-specific DNA-methyltransferase [Polyangiaceae bacterium]
MTGSLAAVTGTSAASIGSSGKSRGREHVIGPRLSWSGTTWRDDDAKAAPPILPHERIGATSGDTHRFVFGDALDVAHALADEGLRGKVDLVYLDPPFASRADYVHEVRLDGRADGRVRRVLAYEDSTDIAPYLEDLAPRLRALVALLSPSGTIWVHLDWRAAYLVRVLLDELVGRDRFLNEIVWRRAPNLGRQAASHQFGRTLDTLIVYGGKDAKLVPPTRLEPIEPSAIRFDDEGRPFTTAPRGDYTDASIARLETEGRVHRTATGKVYIKYFLEKDASGTWCRARRVDALWTDVPPLRHVAVSERTGYPTQKPRALLERIITSATPKGGLVVDLFSGSGTTAEAAHVTGRRAIVGDRGPVALATTRARMLRAGAPLSIDTCGTTPPVVRGDGAVRVRVTTGARNEVSVSLLRPREPLAWSVARRTDRDVVVLAHSERGLGASAAPVADVLAFDGRGVAGDLVVRVHEDDGTVRECDVALTNGRAGRSTSRSEGVPS